MSIVYADPSTGPSAGGIGWVDFGNLELLPGQNQNIKGTLKDGTTVSFNIESSTFFTNVRSISSKPSPINNSVNFGNTGYRDIPKNPILTLGKVLNPGGISDVSNTQILLSQIELNDINGNPIFNYTVIVADAGSTNALPNGINESLYMQSDGFGWSLFTTLGSGVSPKLEGIGTNTVTITGTQTSPNESDFVLTTDDAEILAVTFTTANDETQSQSIAIGFAITKVEVKKEIQGRLDSKDQFELSIDGTFTVPVTSTTEGDTNGLQSESAISYGLSNIITTVNEEMAQGSINSLSAYTKTVKAVNISPNQTIPPVGNLPQTFTTMLGDIIIYTITNSMIPVKATKSVDKNYVGLNDTITYTIAIDNPNPGILSGVSVKDLIPSNTTFVDNSISVTNASIVGNNISSGITLNNIPANTTALVSFKVKTGETIKNLNIISNIATIKDPTGQTLDTNKVETKINYAKLDIQKTTIKSISYIKDTIKYNISVTNNGNIDAQDIVIEDVLPLGVSYVLGSFIANVEYSGDITTGIKLTNPIAKGETVFISFEIIINDIPNPNPINNVAIAKFIYFPDPNNSVSISSQAKSNEETTFILKYNFSNQITDIINSIAKEQVSLSEIINAEGLKIQSMLIMKNITTSQLLCLNESVADTLELISLLEGILKQKLNALSCQINNGKC